MKDGEQEFVGYHGGNVDGKPINDVQSSIVGQLWSTRGNFLVLDEGINQNDVASVCQDEEEKEVDSEHKVSVLECHLLLCNRHCLYPLDFIGYRHRKHHIVLQNCGSHPLSVDRRQYFRHHVLPRSRWIVPSSHVEGLY